MDQKSGVFGVLVVGLLSIMLLCAFQFNRSEILCRKTSLVQTIRKNILKDEIMSGECKAKAEAEANGVLWRKNRDGESLSRIYGRGWLKPGLSEFEVRSILGAPSHDQGDIWEYASDDLGTLFIIVWTKTEPKKIDFTKKQ